MVSAYKDQTSWIKTRGKGAVCYKGTWDGIDGMEGNGVDVYDDLWGGDSVNQSATQTAELGSLLLCSRGEARRGVRKVRDSHVKRA